MELAGVKMKLGSFHSPELTDNTISYYNVAFAC